MSSQITLTRRVKAANCLDSPEASISLVSSKRRCGIRNLREPTKVDRGFAKRLASVPRSVGRLSLTVSPFVLSLCLFLRDPDETPRRWRRWWIRSVAPEANQLSSARGILFSSAAARRLSNWDSDSLVLCDLWRVCVGPPSALDSTARFRVLSFPHLISFLPLPSATISPAASVSSEIKWSHFYRKESRPWTGGNSRNGAVLLVRLALFFFSSIVSPSLIVHLSLPPITRF